MTLNRNMIVDRKDHVQYRTNTKGFQMTTYIYTGSSSEKNIALNMSSAL